MTATTSSVTSAQAKLKFSQKLILAPLPCQQYITRQNTVNGVTIMLFMPSALLPAVSIQAEKVSSVHTEVLQCLKLLKKVHLIILLQADGHLLDLSESISTLSRAKRKNMYSL